MKKLVFGVSLLLAALAFPVAAADSVYMTITSEDGSKPPFEVTDAVIAKVGTKSYQALLPGMDDDALHQAEGPLMRDLLNAAGIDGQTATAVALDNYQIEIPVQDFKSYDVMLAIKVDGKVLTRRDKGPGWIVYPSGDHPEMRKDSVFESRSIWQVKELIIK